jgi:hypothetical protein
MQKVERDGMVGVLVSLGLGAGWSTWNEEHSETLCMDRSTETRVRHHRRGA